MAERFDIGVRLGGDVAKDMIVAAALAGHGLAWVPDDTVAEHIAAGRLVSVLDDWSQTFPGYHAYYATRSASPRWRKRRFLAGTSALIARGTADLIDVDELV